jgi:hypothetical protein
MFDLTMLKRASGLTPEELSRLEDQLREEFPRDEMMLELHLLRILEALRKGWITREDALRESVTV